MPGSTPATSQIDWLNSMTAMIVLFWSRATRDLLKSFSWGIAALHRFMQRRSCHLLAARPIGSFGSRTRHRAVRPRRGRFPVIGSSPHWPGGTGISNLRPLAGWISALERGRFQGHKQKRKLKSVAPFARNRKFESISLHRRVSPTQLGRSRGRGTPSTVPRRRKPSGDRTYHRPNVALIDVSGEPIE